MPPSCRGPTSTWTPPSRWSGRSAPTWPTAGSRALRHWSQRFDHVVPDVVPGAGRRAAPRRPSARPPTSGPPSRWRSAGGGWSARPSSARPTTDVAVAPGAVGHPADDPGRTGSACTCPGGLAPLASSVIMNVVPAQVAGVASIAVASPPQRGFRRAAAPEHPRRCVTCSGWRRCTRSAAPRRSPCSPTGCPDLCRPVNLVTGPGNIYVVAAKRLLKGRVNIDSEAGPTEIAILADDTADPVHVAADLISQAEHDPLAAAVLVTDSEPIWPTPSRPSWRRRCRQPSTSSGSTEALTGHAVGRGAGRRCRSGRWRWSTRTPPSTWRSRPPTPSRRRPDHATPARSSSGPGRRCPWVTTAPAAPTYCRRRAAPAIPRG